MNIYKTIKSIRGPLIIIEGVKDVAFKELAEITLDDGTVVSGQVLEIYEDKAVVQVFEGTTGLSPKEVKVKFKGETAKLGVSKDMLGRVFDGMGRPLDNLPVFAEKKLDINGKPINPAARLNPNEFIQTGVSTIDCMTPLVRGQKLPIFSLSGMPHNKLAAQIARQATVLDNAEFAVVFAAMGISQSEADFFRTEFEKTGTLNNTVLFLNLASDPAVARIMTPRVALTTAEYLAFEHDMHVLVIMTDVTNYCEALREISAARKEVPGRRGYPGYMYTDLAMNYERAGKIEGCKGSVTQLPILTMPGDDKTHPVPDLTGYITEGQIIIDRKLFKSNVLPPINILGSLSRLKVGKGQVREDASSLADQLYAAYATGKELRDLVAVVGKSALSKTDLLYLEFADLFEHKFVGQSFMLNRTIDETLDVGWDCLKDLPKAELKKLKKEHIEKYHPDNRKSEKKNSQMEVSPTRSELLEMKKRIALAKRGHALLKKKQDVLMMEILKRLKEYRAAKTGILSNLEKAYENLAMDIAYTSVFALKSASYSMGEQFTIEHETLNIMGLKLPKITAQQAKNTMPVYEGSPILAQTTRSFRSLFEKLVTLSSMEITIKALAEEISKIKRRVNSLENIQIPKLEQMKKEIMFVLEEQERENFVKLKVIKESLEE